MELSPNLSPLQKEALSYVIPYISRVTRGVGGVVQPPVGGCNLKKAPQVKGFIKEYELKKLKKVVVTKVVTNPREAVR